MRIAILKIVCALVVVLPLAAPTHSLAATEIVLHSFCSKHHCSDGAYPAGRLRISRDGGGIYGVASAGGGTQSKGVVFQLNAQGNFKTLYDFCRDSQCTDGSYPMAGVIRRDRILYGTTSAQGAVTGDCFIGCGTIFKLDSNDTETTLYSFLGGSDGGQPNTTLTMDDAGNLYGTTAEGGLSPDMCNGRCGTIFRLAPDGTEIVLYRFCSQSQNHKCADGARPSTRVLFDDAGNILGATYWGGLGCRRGSCGIIFKLAPDGSQSVLYSFTGNKDGSGPNSLIRDGRGNLYGTTGSGAGTCFQYGCGTVFKIAPDGQEITLYRFCSELNCADGARPNALVADRTGNLYGTTTVGGNTAACSGIGCGTVFKLASDGTLTTLYAFCSETNCTDGASPSGGLVIDDAGNLYGATANGGDTNQGVLFEIQP